jgi:hypothetical protein
MMTRGRESSPAAQNGRPMWALPRFWNSALIKLVSEPAVGVVRLM